MKKTDKTKLILLSAILFVLFAWVGTWVIMVNTDYFHAWTQRGQFGDMFGAVNALFSGLAFAFFIATVYLQSVELRETREDIRKQTEQFKEQNQNLKIQRFESTFFQLLRVFNELISQLDLYLRKHGDGHSGRDAFIEFETVRTSVFNESKSAQHRKVVDESFDRIFKRSRGFYNYFRTFQSMLSFVESSSVNDKHKYIDIIYAQLEVQEQVGLMFYCYSGYGKDLKPLVETFGLLRDFPFKVVSISDNIKSHFNDSAFKSYVDPSSSESPSSS